MVVPPRLAQTPIKSKKNCGNNTSRSLDKGVVYARPPKTQAATGRGASLTSRPSCPWRPCDVASRNRNARFTICCQGQPFAAPQSQKNRHPKSENGIRWFHKSRKQPPALFGHGRSLCRGGWAGGGGGGLGYYTQPAEHHMSGVCGQTFWRASIGSRTRVGTQSPEAGWRVRHGRHAPVPWAQVSLLRSLLPKTRTGRRPLRLGLGTSPEQRHDDALRGGWGRAGGIGRGERGRWGVAAATDVLERGVPCVAPSATTRDPPPPQTVALVTGTPTGRLDLRQRPSSVVVLRYSSRVVPQTSFAALQTASHAPQTSFLLPQTSLMIIARCAPECVHCTPDVVC